MGDAFSFEDPDAGIDLTPLVDTVFMLLIFFIMATTFSKPVLEVALQEAKGAVVVNDRTEPMTITITLEGRILVGEEEIALEALEAFFATRPKEEGLLFNVDKKAPFGVFVAAVDIAKKQGKENFAIVTAPQEREK